VNSIFRVLGLGLLMLTTSGISIAQQPKYLPCPYQQRDCREDLGHENSRLGHVVKTNGGCTGWCTNDPLLMSPTIIEACEDQSFQVNFRIAGNKMDIMGNAVTTSGGQIDWDDGSTEPLFTGGALNQDVTHKYHTARTYFPSARYSTDFKYDGSGSCSYRCATQQADVAIVYLKTGPNCTGGIFKATATSEKHKAAVTAQFATKMAAPPKTAAARALVRPSKAQ
jgi:hypothetical protein